jgi:hypothetical protein
MTFVFQSGPHPNTTRERISYTNSTQQTSFYLARSPHFFVDFGVLIATLFGFLQTCHILSIFYAQPLASAVSKSLLADFTRSGSVINRRLNIAKPFPTLIAASCAALVPAEAAKSG